MSNMSRVQALFEDLASRFDALVEIFIPMRKELTEVKELVSRIPAIEADIKVMKLALTQTNTEVKDHEHRITRLEAKVG